MRWPLLLRLVLISLSLLLTGCVSPEQESDWRWQQFNPEYRPPYPRDERSMW